MADVTYRELLEFVATHGDVGSEDVDNSIEGVIYQDFWDNDHKNVIACIYHYNDNQVVYRIFEDRVQLKPSTDEYEDSAEFTEEFTTAMEIINSPKVAAWMQMTDENHGTDTTHKLIAVQTALDDLWGELEEAD